MNEQSDKLETGTLREVYEGCFQPGVTVRYRGLRLECLAWSDDELWRVFRGDEWVTSVRPREYPSATMLQQYLDAIADNDEPQPAMRCGNCAFSARPTD